MQRSLLTNIILFVFVVALGTFMFTDEIDQNGVVKLSDLTADSIQRIEIHHRQREILIEKQDGNWQIKTPIAIAANQFRIKTILSMLDTSSHAQYDVNGLDLKKYDLDNTKTSIRLNDTAFEFGNTNPINNDRYVKVGDTLHLIEDLFYPLLSSQIGTLVARELIPENKTINKLVLPEQTLSRDENGLWQGDKDVSSDAIVEIIYQWQHKQAFSVHDYTRHDALGEIQVYLDNADSPINFTITATEPWLIIARPDLELEYHFNVEDYDALLRPGVFTQTPGDSLQVSPDEFMDTIQSTR